MDDGIFNPLPSAVILSVFVIQLLFFFVSHIGATRGILSCKGGQLRRIL